MLNFISNALGLLCLHVQVSDVAVAMLGLFVMSCVREKMTKKGPMTWPVLGLIPTVAANIGRVYDWMTAELTEAGGTFAYRGMWLGGAHGILTADPVNVEYILRTKTLSFPKGPYYRERFRDLLGDGIFNADGDTWRRQRRIAAAEMHSARFARFSAESMQDLVQDKLLVVIENLVKNNEAIDLQDLLLRFTFDNICTAALGVNPGCLDQAAGDDNYHLSEVPFAKAFEEATELTLRRFLVPPFVWKTMKRLGLGFEKRLDLANRFVRGFADQVVKERRVELLTKPSGFQTRFDLLSRMMDLDGERLSDEFLVDFCISFILAGRDTSSVALAWFFWLLHKNPDVNCRVLAEIDAVSSSRGDNETAAFTAEEVKGMYYLEAALTEAMRLYPPVPIDMKESKEEEEVFPDGSAVSKGARVMYCIFAMGRSESIWGPDWGDFRPERWIVVDGETIKIAKGESQFRYAVFNGGPRLCLGKAFAYTQMKILAASVLAKYEIRVLEGQKIEPKVTTTLYMKNGLFVTFKPRFLHH